MLMLMCVGGYHVHVSVYVCVCVGGGDSPDRVRAAARAGREGGSVVP